MISQAEALITDTKKREFVDISSNKGEDIEKWSRTSEPPSTDINVYTIDGNAKILNNATGDSLAQTLRISDQQYLIALMIFFVAYIVFETPSNYMLKKSNPSRW
ncbi:hypothetical protein PHLCEN_2v9481 [Hermanssonia centrifuga]|uniref:Uncharacterized protein n=1 Tax=Hermanssonia centrifuga TaxID=98765 RepID=A0A2R6NQQ4_9APHY|nr:hypothetical protein PHLCEN_2v9481 [Hermanssonia centrifuga]